MWSRRNWNRCKPAWSLIILVWISFSETTQKNFNELKSFCLRNKAKASTNGTSCLISLLVAVKTGRRVSWLCKLPLAKNNPELVVGKQCLVWNLQINLGILLWIYSSCSMMLHLFVQLVFGKQANGLASQDLLEKYFHDGLLVDDLIARKTEQGLYESNPDFPSREDLAKTMYIYMIYVYIENLDCFNHFYQRHKYSPRRIFGSFGAGTPL